MSNRIEIRVYVSEDERDRLDQEAAAMEVSRGQLIRERALAAAAISPWTVSRPNMRIYSAAVDRAARVAAGVPRPQLEAIVAATLQALVESQAEPSCATAL